MTTLYLICLVVGGGVALLSAFGDFLDLDAGDADLDFDADVGEVGDVGGGGLGAAIFSLRAFVFTLFGFGAVGGLLTALGSASDSPVTIVFAVLAGMVVGGLVGMVLAYLKRSDSGTRGDDSGFVGLVGRVTLPIRGGTPGQIVLQRGHREHAVRALPHAGAPGDPAAWSRVVVVDMREGVAYVGPLSETEQQLLP